MLKIFILNNVQQKSKRETKSHFIGGSKRSNCSIFFIFMELCGKFGVIFKTQNYTCLGSLNLNLPLEILDPPLNLFEFFTIGNSARSGTLGIFELKGY